LGEASIHPTAVVDAGAQIGAGTRVWHFCHVMAGAHIGPGCVLGQNVFVGRDVKIGEGTKIQNNVSVYEGVRIGQRCFVGPSAVFTNVKTPRAEVERKDAFLDTDVGDGATIGANATIVCGARIGRYAVVGAGAVVTGDVAAHRLVHGVPAREQGWACRCGAVLGAELDCPECGRAYRAAGGGIEEGRA
jgi:UDP-2-acetamido-3-amino-2,3-dideoxy-glucuronate N-acetyltransferase